MIRRFKKLRTRGAVAASSPHLIKKMLDEIDFSSTETVVEFGVGDGCFTEEILRRMPKDSKLICFEIDADCCKVVRDKISDERLILLETGAENVTAELKKLGMKKADAVVSSLPLAVIKKTIVRSIIRQVKALLGKHGRYVQFQYSLASNRDIKKYFSSVERKFELLNIPPAIIYSCRN
ncbi:MAG: methyltransferase domain-containing protein [Bacteroidetes bacterium]|nr:methyltransferase domain-containing protein [Bacteroidota bacterium]